MAQAFRANQLGSPVHDARGRLDAVLVAQLRGYAIHDPETKQSQALPAAVVSIVEAAIAAETHQAVGQLFVGAFFFAMQAFEFSDVGGGPRRTKIITVGDVEFRRDVQKIDVSDEEEMFATDTVSITFRTQMKGEKGTTVTQHKTAGASMGGARLCPVTSFARLVARVRRRYQLDDLERAEPDRRSINLITTTKKGTIPVTAQQVLHHLRAAALQYGEQRLGFPISKIGTHSLRAGAATAMFLAGVPAETQLIGRWQSQIFLRYIRIQVQQLTRGVATDMTTNPNFLTIGQE